MRKLTFAASLILLLPTLSRAGMAEHVQRKDVVGIDVLTYRTGVKDVVTIEGALPGGAAAVRTPIQNPTVADVTAMMLSRGTTKQDRFAIGKKLKAVGATVRFSTKADALWINAQCLTKELPVVMNLVGEQLRAPAFLPDEFDKARQQYIGQLKNSMDSVQYRGNEAFADAVFPAGHPNYQPTIAEALSGADRLTLDEVKAFHARYYGPDHMTLVVVGDVEGSQVQRAVAAAFKGWKGGERYLKADKPANLVAPEPRERTVEMAGKTSTIVEIGQATGMRYEDPDAIALRVGTAILGSGFTGRLMHSVRVQEGLTYGIGANVGYDTINDGAWFITATFAPQLLERGLISTRRELMKWWSEGVTADELSARKANMIGSFQVGLATTAGVAHTLLNVVQSGRGVTWLDRYPRAVQELTVDQVNAAIKKHLDPDKMVTVKVGTVPAGDSRNPATKGTPP